MAMLAFTSTQIHAQTGSWQLAGNILAGTEKLGSTNAIDLKIVTGNIERFHITKTGNIYPSNQGTGNQFFRYQAGISNTTGTLNTFDGDLTGKANTTGSSNSFFGQFSGVANISGNYNTFIG